MSVHRAPGRSGIRRGRGGVVCAVRRRRRRGSSTLQRATRSQRAPGPRTHANRAPVPRPHSRERSCCTWPPTAWSHGVCRRALCRPAHSLERARARQPGHRSRRGCRVCGSWPQRLPLRRCAHHDEPDHIQPWRPRPPPSTEARWPAGRSAAGEAWDTQRDCSAALQALPHSCLRDAALGLGRRRGSLRGGVLANLFASSHWDEQTARSKCPPRMGAPTFWARRNRACTAAIGPSALRVH